MKKSFEELDEEFSKVLYLFCNLKTVQKNFWKESKIWGLTKKILKDKVEKLSKVFQGLVCSFRINIMGIYICDHLTIKKF